MLKSAKQTSSWFLGTCFSPGLSPGLVLTGCRTPDNSQFPRHRRGPAASLPMCPCRKAASSRQALTAKSLGGSAGGGCSGCYRAWRSARGKIKRWDGWQVIGLLAPVSIQRSWRYSGLTLFLVLSLRKGRITVYRAWMYQGWFTKWIPPNLAGKLSWRHNKQIIRDLTGVAGKHVLCTMIRTFRLHSEINKVFLNLESVSSWTIVFPVSIECQRIKEYLCWVLSIFH